MSDCLCFEPVEIYPIVSFGIPTEQGMTYNVFPGFSAFFPLTNGNKAFPKDSKSSPQSKS